MAKILIVGCGNIGTKFAKILIAKGHQVTGLKRHPPSTPEPGVTYHAADICVATELEGLPTDFEQVFFILAPDKRDATSYNAVYDLGLNNLLAHFTQANIKPSWLLVSSTSVYGQTQGEWVDESSATKPTTDTGRAILKAEQRIIASSRENCVLRFSGIYGLGREHLLRSTRLMQTTQKSPPYYTNRIHELDCLNILLFLCEQRLADATLDQCYLASDDDPASQWDVMNWLAERLHCPAPSPLVLAESADQNKRCSNRRLKNLGYSFLYPSYQDGYAELIDLMMDA